MVLRPEGTSHNDDAVTSPCGRAAVKIQLQERAVECEIMVDDAQKKCTENLEQKFPNSWARESQTERYDQARGSVQNQEHRSV